MRNTIAGCLLFSLILVIHAAPPPREPYSAKAFRTFPSYSDVGYDQKLRPQFHFTSRKNWLNDPNGMVYYGGEWHMHFQHNAQFNNTGMKSWGNAVSTDLFHWQQYPHAIIPYPNVFGEKDKLHSIWSGSAVVDELNALGKQKGDVKTLFAVFTATCATGFFQAGAYSTDKGRTWVMINGGKPLIPHQKGFSRGQRDPRVFYYAPGKCYVTIMMIGGPERKVRLWKSIDLLHWEQFLDIPNKAAECIDMYQVAVDADPNNRKWVISNAGTGYEVGEFDGKSWKGLGGPDGQNPKRQFRFEYGDSFYAAQTFNQGPDHRVVHIGWLRSKAFGFRPFLEAGMPFTQQMSVPAEITLRTTPTGIRIYRNPVDEIKKLYTKTTKLGPGKASEINSKLAQLKPELIDLTLEFTPKADLSLNVRGLKIDYLAEAKVVRFTNSQRVNGIKAAVAKSKKKKIRYNPRDTGARDIPADMLVNGKVKIRVLVDRASLEIFVNDGIAAGSFVVVPDAANRSIALASSADVQIDSIVVNELKSIWNSQ